VEYVGQPASPDVIAVADEPEITAVLTHFRCRPIFLSTKLQDNFRRGFCRDTLWGVLHNVVDVFGHRPTRWWNRSAQDQRWTAYKEFNRMVASKIVQLYSTNTIVWAHGHEFLLLPQTLGRHVQRSAVVGLFLDAPFPSSEIFRSLSVREDLLRGMLVAGQIGFHLYEYARHFSTACKRILALHETRNDTEDSAHPGAMVIEHGGCKVSVSVSHGGIEPTVFARTVQSTSARVECEQLRKILVQRDETTLSRVRASLKTHGSYTTPAAHPHKAPRTLASRGYVLRRDSAPLLAVIVAAMHEAASTPVSGSASPCDRRAAPAWGSLASPTTAAKATSSTPPAAASAASAATAQGGDDSSGGGERARPSGAAASPSRVAEHLRRRRLAVGVESLTRLDGIPLKMLAWESLLQKRPEWVQRAMLVQVCVWDAECLAESVAVWQEVCHIADRINARFATGSDGRMCPAVLLVERFAPVPGHTRAALFSAADILVSLPLRSGFRTEPLEYVWAAAPEGVGGYSPPGEARCRVESASGGRCSALELDAAKAARPGVSVLSEFMATARVLSGALRVNPWRLDETVAAIDLALRMTGSERVARWESSASFVGQCSTSDWAERILTDLKRSAVWASTRSVVRIGFGSTFHHVNYAPTFAALQEDKLLRSFRRASRRVIFTDYGGTLNTAESAEARRRLAHTGAKLGRGDIPRITPEVRASLLQLSQDPRTVVFVISGKERPVLEQAFAGLPDVGLAAEHGFYYRWPAKLCNTERTGSTGQWHRLLGRTELTWKDVALSIMELYMVRTNGTYILCKGSAVAWHFSDADPEFGSMQAKELKDHLDKLLESHPVEVVSGLDYVEVRPRGVNKGKIATFLLEQLEAIMSQSPNPVTAVTRPATHDTSWSWRGGVANPSPQRHRGIFGMLPDAPPLSPLTDSASIVGPSDSGRAASHGLPASGSGTFDVAAQGVPRIGSAASGLAAAAAAASADPGFYVPKGVGSEAPRTDRSSIVQRSPLVGAFGAHLPTVSPLSSPPHPPERGSSDRVSEAGISAAATAAGPSSSQSRHRHQHDHSGTSSASSPAGGQAGTAMGTGHIEFVMAAGDDTADEQMFEAVNAWGKHFKAARGRYSVAVSPARGALRAPSSPPASSHRHPAARGLKASVHGSEASLSTIMPRRAAGASRHADVFTVTVGQKPSKAQAFVEDSIVMEDVFCAMARVSASAVRTRSMTELNAAARSHADQSARAAARGEGDEVSGPMAMLLDPSANPYSVDAGVPGSGTAPPSSGSRSSSFRKRAGSGASSNSSSSFHHAALAATMGMVDRGGIPGLEFGASGVPRIPSVVDVSLGLAKLAGVAFNPTSAAVAAASSVSGDPAQQEAAESLAGSSRPPSSAASAVAAPFGPARPTGGSHHRARSSDLGDARGQHGAGAMSRDLMIQQAAHEAGLPAPPSSGSALHLLGLVPGSGVADDGLDMAPPTAQAHASWRHSAMRNAARASSASNTGTMTRSVSGTLHEYNSAIEESKHDRFEF
jgi:trehalose-phosphatase